MEDNTSQLKNLDNTQLIERVESIGIDYVILVREALLRIGNRQFSDEEYQRFTGIGEKTRVALLDLAPNVAKYDEKKSITDAVSQVVDKAYDKNR